MIKASQTASQHDHRVDTIYGRALSATLVGTRYVPFQRLDVYIGLFVTDAAFEEFMAGCGLISDA